MKLAIAAALALSLSACARPYTVPMPPATPDIIVRPHSAATFAIEPGSGADPLCLYEAYDLRCVRGVRHEFEAGLDTILNSFLSPSGTSQATYVARLGPIAVTERAGGRSARNSIVIDWEFTLTDASGRVVIRLRDTTLGSRPIDAGPFGLAAPLEGVEDDVLERIRSALADSIVAHPASS